MPVNSIFDGPITNLLSILCILIEIVSRARAKGGKSLNDFKFGTIVGRFQSDGVASMAVKRLTTSCFRSGIAGDREPRRLGKKEFIIAIVTHLSVTIRLQH